MKANTNEICPDFPGIVLDPETGRKCALQIDIFRGLKLAGDQVAKTGARIYQHRYYDILDVIQGREKVKRVGRPRGFALTVNMEGAQ